MHKFAKMFAIDEKTLVTTKYTVPNPNRARIKKRAEARRKHAAAKTAASGVQNASDVDTQAEDGATSAAAQSLQQPATATLILKTFDPVSGTCLKFQTNKQQDVGRLVGSLARLGRTMAALPSTEGKNAVDGGVEKEAGGDVVMTDSGKKTAGGDKNYSKSAAGQDIVESTGGQAGDVAGGGGKKAKKKKGRK